jgi:hypothetical protein
LVSGIYQVLEALLRLVQLFWCNYCNTRTVENYFTKSSLVVYRNVAQAKNNLLKCQYLYFSGILLSDIIPFLNRNQVGEKYHNDCSENNFSIIFLYISVTQLGTHESAGSEQNILYWLPVSFAFSILSFSSFIENI